MSYLRFLSWNFFIHTSIYHLFSFCHHMKNRIMSSHIMPNLPCFCAKCSKTDSFFYHQQSIFLQKSIEFFLNTMYNKYQ